jgi:hypothetical protein
MSASEQIPPEKPFRVTCIQLQCSCQAGGVIPPPGLRNIPVRTVFGSPITLNPVEDCIFHRRITAYTSPLRHSQPFVIKIKC